MIRLIAALVVTLLSVEANAWDNWPPKTFSNENGHITLDDPMFTPVKEMPQWLKEGVTLFVHQPCETARCEQLNAAYELTPIHSFQQNIMVRGKFCDAVLLGWQGADGTPYRCLDEIVNSGNFYIRADDPVLLGKKPQALSPSQPGEDDDSFSIGMTQEEFDKAIPPADFSKTK